MGLQYKDTTTKDDSKESTTDITMVDYSQNNKNSKKHNKHSKSNGVAMNGSTRKPRSKNSKQDDDDTMSVDDTDDGGTDESMMKAVSDEIQQHPPWESPDRSEMCPDCDAEQLGRRREYEKAEIRRLEDDGCPQDCALEMKWANSWRNFVHNKTDEVPSRVDNRSIHAGNHQLKEDMAKDRDYLMIPSNIWTFLIEIYGGGPKIVPTLSRTMTPTKTPQRGNRSNRPNQTSRTPSRGSSGKTSSRDESQSTRSSRARSPRSARSNRSEH